MKQKLTFLFIAFLLATGSCKKDGPKDNSVIGQAKSWYVSAFAKANARLESDHSTFKKIRQDIQWENARDYLLENNQHLVGVPVTVTLNDNQQAAGSYMLAISKGGGKYSSLMMYNKQKDFFKAGLSDADIRQEYRAALAKKVVRDNSKLS